MIIGGHAAAAVAINYGLVGPEGFQLAIMVVDRALLVYVLYAL